MLIKSSLRTFSSCRDAGIKCSLNLKLKPIVVTDIQALSAHREPIASSCRDTSVNFR